MQRRHNCSSAASFANCFMTLYLSKVHLQTFVSIPITKKCQILSCDTLVANEICMFLHSNFLRICYCENQVAGTQPIGTDTTLRAGRNSNSGSIPEKCKRLFSLLNSIHTGSVAQPASYSISTGSSLSARGALVPRLGTWRPTSQFLRSCDRAS